MAFKYKSCLNVLMAHCSVPQVQLVLAAMNAGTHKRCCSAARRMHEFTLLIFLYLPSQWTLQEWVPHLFFACTKFQNTCWNTLQRKCHFVMSQRALKPLQNEHHPDSHSECPFSNVGGAVKYQFFCRNLICIFFKLATGNRGLNML